MIASGLSTHGFGPGDQAGPVLLSGHCKQAPPSHQGGKSAAALA